MHDIGGENHHDVHDVVRVAEEVEFSYEPALGDVGRADEGARYRDDVL